MRTRCCTFLIMPRTSGLSTSSRLRWRLFSPSPISVPRWSSVRPMGLPVWVILIFLPSAIAYSLSRRLGGGLVAATQKVTDLLAAAGGDHARRIELQQRLERRLDHVVRVGRADRLGDDVLDAERLEHGAHRAAGDDAGAGRGGAQRHLAGAEAAFDVMMQRAAVAQRHADQPALGRLGRLADRLRHLARLAGAVADAAALVADDDDPGKGEAPAALHHLRHAIDGDQLVLQFVVLVAIAVAPAIARGTAGTTG